MAFRSVAQTARGFLFATGLEIGRAHLLRSQFVDASLGLLLHPFSTPATRPRSLSSEYRVATHTIGRRRPAGTRP